MRNALNNNQTFSKFDLEKYTNTPDAIRYMVRIRSRIPAVKTTTVMCDKISVYDKPYARRTLIQLFPLEYAISEIKKFKKQFKQKSNYNNIDKNSWNAILGILLSIQTDRIALLTLENKE